MDDDALKYRQHAKKIRHLVASVRGHAATAALLLAEEYENRADRLEGQPTATAYVANVEQVGELIASTRETIAELDRSEAALTAELAAVRQQRLLAETRLEAILLTARLFDVPKLPHSAASRITDPQAVEAVGA